MRNQYDGTEKIAVIETGVDEYIQWPDTVQEGVASGRSLIRRYSKLNRQDNGLLTILSQGNIFISVDYHKVFINTFEVSFPRREFDLFYLLVSNPGRVFTQEQLYQSIWGSDYVPTENSLHSCIRRIRRKLESVDRNLPILLHIPISCPRTQPGAAFLLSFSDGQHRFTALPSPTLK